MSKRSLYFAVVLCLALWAKACSPSVPGTEGTHQETTHEYEQKVESTQQEPSSEGSPPEGNPPEEASPENVQSEPSVTPDEPTQAEPIVEQTQSQEPITPEKQVDGGLQQDNFVQESITKEEAIQETPAKEVTPEPQKEATPEPIPPKNQAPKLYLVLKGKNIRPFPGQTLTANKPVTLYFKGIDPDKDPLKFQTNKLPKFALFSSKANGTATLRLAPLDKDAGAYTFSITALDGKGGKDTQNLKVTVKSTLPPPKGTQVAKPIKTTKAPYGHYVYLPGDYKSKPNAKFPLLIFLHGLGEKGNGTSDLKKVLKHGPPKLINNGTWNKVNKHPFIVISPQSWSGWWGAELIRQLIDYAKQTYRVDERRVYLTGLSAGAISTFSYITKYQDQVAAIIPIAGNGSSQVQEMCNLLQIPMWAFHGSNDRTVGWGGSKNPVEAVNKCNPKAREHARLTLYTGVGHDSWNRTYDLSGMKSKQDPKYHPFKENIYDWLMKHVRVAKPDTAPVVSGFKVPTAKVGGTYTFKVKATDKDGHKITLSSTTIKTFVTFKDNGGGNGTYTLKPLAANKGTHFIYLTAKDTSGKKDVIRWKLVIP